MPNKKDHSTTNSHMISKCNESEGTSTLFPNEMISKLETILSTVQQDKAQTQTPHKTRGAKINNES